MSDFSFGLFVNPLNDLLIILLQIILNLSLVELLCQVLQILILNSRENALSLPGLHVQLNLLILLRRDLILVAFLARVLGLIIQIVLYNILPPLSTHLLFFLYFPLSVNILSHYKYNELKVGVAILPNRDQ